MKRRDLLASLGASVALTGCQGTVWSGGSDSPSETDGTTTANPTSRTPAVASSTPLSAVPCPPSDADRAAVCSQTVDADAASVYLLPSRTAVDPSTETLDLTLHNESSSDLTFNPHSWTLRTRRDSGWAELDDRVSGDGRRTLESGHARSWSLRAVVNAVDPERTLEPGRYAAEIGVPDPDGSEWLACVAVFDVE